MNNSLLTALLLFLVAILVAGCGMRLAAAPASAEDGSVRLYMLSTDHVDGRMVFVGADGLIEGIVNPDLEAAPGETVEIVLVNGDGMAHDIAVPELAVKSQTTWGEGKTTSISFVVPKEAAGAYTYVCTVSGHRQAGMEGRIIVRSARG